MKITLLTVGKTDVPWVRQGLEIYVSRLSHYVPFRLEEIPQLKKVSSFSEEQIKTREGALLLSKIKPSDKLILLYERGEEFTSLRFARFIEDSA